MVGSPHKDLRYFVRIRTGAIPQLDSPEEVALINVDGGGMNDGIWYSEHLASELSSGKASSNEDKRLFATKHYTIETVIGKNNHFFSRAAITFSPLLEGERVLKFGLLPTLRVTRVSDENGKDLHFIQENRKEDGSFYAILDEALPVGKDHTITIEYAGDKRELLRRRARVVVSQPERLRRKGSLRFNLQSSQKQCRHQRWPAAKPVNRRRLCRFPLGYTVARDGRRL